MSIKTTRQRLAASQTGMVAIMVTMILMIIISLLILGFAQISRREQRNSLNVQLSTQAYYAAESGVNDTAANIQNQLNTIGTVAAKTDCSDSGPYQFDSSAPAQSTLSTGVSYSCILVDPTPTSLMYKNVSQDGVVIPLIPATSNISTLTLTWSPAPGQETQSIATCPAGAGSLRQASNWNCKYPLLRIDLVPVSTLSRAALLANSRTNYIEPLSGGAAGSLTAGQNGTVVGVVCPSVSYTATCTKTISGFGLGPYYMRVAAIYRTTGTLTITGISTNGKPIEFAGAQATIDSTGQAQGVLRRILVSVDLTDANAHNAPNAALISGDSVCKRFSVTPGYFSNSLLAGGNGNDLCAANTSGTPGP